MSFCVTESHEPAVAISVTLQILKDFKSCIRTVVRKIVSAILAITMKRDRPEQTWQPPVPSISVSCVQRVGSEGHW